MKTKTIDHKYTHGYETGMGDGYGFWHPVRAERRREFSLEPRAKLAFAMRQPDGTRLVKVVRGICAPLYLKVSFYRYDYPKAKRRN